MNKDSDVEKIVISNELQAVDLLERYNANPDLIDFTSIEIKGWENFTLHLKGDKFHNSITPSVMKGVIDLQQALYESFAIAVYNERNTSRLTHEQRKQLEIQVVVSDGSSILDIDPNAIVESFMKGAIGSMTPEQTTMTVLFFIVSFFGSAVWKHWLDNRKEIKQKESDNKLQETVVIKNAEVTESVTKENAEVTKRIIDVLEKTAENNVTAKNIFNKSDEVRRKIVRSTRYADSVGIKELEELTGDEADYLTTKPKADWKPIRLDGRYRLLQVNSANSLARKVTIQNLESERRITALLEDDTLDKRHLQSLGTAEWGFHPVQLKIKAKMLKGQIKEAEIISVDFIETDIVFDDSEDE